MRIINKLLFKSASNEMIGQHERRNLVKIREVLGHEVHTHECVKSIGYTSVFVRMRNKSSKVMSLRHEL